MSAQDRVRWDQVYRDLSQRSFPPPDPLLFEYVPAPTTATSRALDFASGLGQNGLWLADQGYTVDLMDISRVALARTRGEMAIRNLRNVNLLQVDLDDARLEPDYYEVVCVFRYLKRSLLPELANTISPGGRIIYETFNLRYLNIISGFNPDFLLHPGELAAAFDGWNILLDTDVEHISQFIALKPDP
ncbi:MAG: methyltransferase domain-containing protein [Anaerolineae bacterium]|nr:methyltransferase domain-containing protein [Anaerolineae bacterium]